MNAENIIDFLLKAFVLVAAGVSVYCLADIRERVIKIQKALNIK